MTDEPLCSCGSELYVIKGGYLNADGENCYSTRFDSTVPTSTVLGLLELAKVQVLAESDFPA